MLQLVLNTPKASRDGSAELFIDYQSESVGFTVVTKDGLQYDFSCEVEEWQQLKSFIEQAISRDGKNKTRTNVD